jgi:phosphoglycolate phosphatase
MIGDTTHDLEMAQSAGVDGIAVSYGAHPADTLKAAKSLACLDNVEQLVIWLQNNLYVQHPTPIEISK